MEYLWALLSFFIYILDVDILSLLLGPLLKYRNPNRHERTYIMVYLSVVVLLFIYLTDVFLNFENT